MKFYRYIFYKVYNAYKRSPISDNLNEWNATLVMAGILFMNINTCLTIMDIIVGKPILLPSNRFVYALYALILLSVHYIIFIYKKRFLDIEKEFSGETKEQCKRGNRYVLLYIVGSIVLFFLVDIIKLLIWAK